jgi:pyruvate formate lyase activating enzyme
MKQATLYKELEDSQVQCQACNHYCLIKDGQTGLCRVRKNKDGKLYLMVYGQISAAHIDPVEKKPLFHFLPGSEILSVGTIGCNFQCAFCQNWQLSQVSGRQGVTKVSPSELKLQEVVQICLDRQIPSIAFTYNEPTIFFEYTFDVAKLAKEKGIKLVYVSNGYASKEAIDKISPYLDAINVDLKSFRDNFYKKICNARLKPVLDNIKRFYENNVWVEVTTLIVPKENDSEEELTQIAEFISSVSPDIPWHISGFTPQYKMDKKPPTASKKIEQAYEIGKKAGLKFVYAGNISDEKLQSSFCPECEELLIRRNWNASQIKGLEIPDPKESQGTCQNCSAKIPGVWN